MAADRADQVEEFLQRKKEAMLNKVRAEGQLVRSVTYTANLLLAPLIKYQTFSLILTMTQCGICGVTLY